MCVCVCVGVCVCACARVITLYSTWCFLYTNKFPECHYALGTCTLQLLAIQIGPYIASVLAQHHIQLSIGHKLHKSTHTHTHTHSSHFEADNIWDHSAMCIQQDTCIKYIHVRTPDTCQLIRPLFFLLAYPGCCILRSLLEASFSRHSWNSTGYATQDWWSAIPLQ